VAEILIFSLVVLFSFKKMFVSIDFIVSKIGLGLFKREKILSK